MCIFNKSVIFFTLFSFCCSFKVFCASSDLKRAVLDGINEDRIIRAKAPLKSDAIVAIKPLPDTGGYADTIYEVQFNNKKPFICKEFKDTKQCDIEAHNFKWWRDYFKNSPEWRSTLFLPHFVWYKGAGEYVDQNKQVKKFVLLEKAKGMPLASLIVDHVLGNKDYYGWKIIGNTLADFHLKFGEVSGNTYVSHTHGDLHASNIFVDGFGLDFIDYAATSYFKKDISTDLKQFFGYSYEYFTGAFMKDVKDAIYNIAKSFKESYQLLDKVAKKIQFVFEEIRQGYVDKFSVKGLNVNIDDDGQATLTRTRVAKRNLKLAPISQTVTLTSFLQVAKKKADAAKVHVPLVAAKPAPKVVAKPVQQVVAKPAPKVPVKPVPPVAVKPAPKVVAKPAPKVPVKPFPPIAAKPAPKVVAKPAPKVPVKPVPPVAVKPAPKVVANPAPKAKAIKAKAKPAPKAKAKSASKAKATKAKAKSASKAKAKSASKAKATKAKAKSVLKAKATKAKAKPAPKAKVKSASKAKATKAKAKSVLKAKAKPASKAKS